MNTESNDWSSTFEIGLTMAGAVSGGAFTAGVLDYFVEALDQWYAAKQQEADTLTVTVPRHKVVIKTASGASAGSMCSAIFGIALNTQFPHVCWDGVSDQNTVIGSGNPFFESWVKKIQIRGLLTTTDYSENKPLPSLLNSQPIDDILREVLDFRGAVAERPWAGNPFIGRFSVTNLRGVSYGVAFNGNTLAGHQMRTHADHCDFKVDVPSGSRWVPQLPELGSAVVLTQQPSSTDGRWQQFGLSAIASGAFPFALKPRRLSRPASDYNSREWVDSSGQMQNHQFILPQRLTNPYNYYVMDGGCINNEPFELARQVLTGSPWDRNPRDGNKANRAVLMIDPFVEGANVPADEAGRSEVTGPTYLQELIAPLFDAMKSQCRFKPEELALAHQADIYSRFLLAPTRGDPSPTPHHPLASGGLGAFLGFCHESYRVHDFLLGRRNAQRFLQHHFTLPRSNPIIQAGYCDDNGQILPQFQHLEAAPNGIPNGEWPIIPLCGNLATKEELLPRWPAGLFKPESLRDVLDARISMIMTALSKETTSSLGIGGRLLTRLGLRLVRLFSKGAIVDKAINTMKQALEKQQLN